ncbi:MAG: Yip1 family protein [Bacteroidales bacterium]
MASEASILTKVLEESKQILKTPKAYFSTMPIGGGVSYPIFKALIYGIVSGIFALLWSLLNVRGYTGGMFVGGTALWAFLLPIIWSVIGVFIGAVIVLVISALAKGSNSFEVNLRVSASLMIFMPITAFLGFTAAIGLTFHSFIALLVNLYALYILYFGVTETLKGEVKTARIIHFIIGGLLILIFLIGLGTKRGVERYSGYTSKKAEKLMKEYREAGEEMAKEYQKASKEMEEEFEGYRIEMANGDIISKADRGDLKDALGELGEDNEYIILRKGDAFVQAMMIEEGFKMSYGDTKGYYKSAGGDISKKNVEDVLTNFMKDNKKWKDKIEWEEVE